jgi:hypothetical protein
MTHPGKLDRNAFEGIDADQAAMKLKRGANSAERDGGKDWPNRRRHAPGACQYRYWPEQM